MSSVARIVENVSLKAMVWVQRKILLLGGTDRFLSGACSASNCRLAQRLYERYERKKAIREDGLSVCLEPGSSLLSHGETPHYHRRYGVSLLSSAWGQVGPPRCCRQAYSVLRPSLFMTTGLKSRFRLKIKLFCLSQNTFGVVRLSLTDH